MAILKIINCDFKRERGRHLRIYKSGDRTVGSYKKKEDVHKSTNPNTIPDV